MIDKTKPTDGPWRVKEVDGSYLILGPDVQSDPECGIDYTRSVVVAKMIANKHDADLICRAVAQYRK